MLLIIGFFLNKIINSLKRESFFIYLHQVSKLENVVCTRRNKPEVKEECCFRFCYKGLGQIWAGHKSPYFNGKICVKEDNSVYGRIPKKGDIFVL